MNDLSTTSNRAGSYEEQTSGIRVFIPAPLPPRPPLRMSRSLQDLHSNASLVLARLEGAAQTVPKPDRFIHMFARKEAVKSSQIEGLQCSVQDVLLAEIQDSNIRTPTKVRETMNCVTALNHGLDRLPAVPLSARLIRELHAELLSDESNSHLTPGDFRASQNWIGPSGSTLRSATFVPPPPQHVVQAISDLEKFIHSDKQISHLIQIALVHVQFEIIHPFLDGNGRVGRLLIPLLLQEYKMLSQPVLYLSHFFRKNRSQYYEELRSIHDHGTWEEWLEFFLRGVVEIGDHALETLRQLLALRERHWHAIHDSMSRAAGNAHRILQHLYKHPIVSVADVQRMLDTSFVVANNLVARLIECGILEEFTGNSRNRLFRYGDYIRLFHESPIES